MNCIYIGLFGDAQLLIPQNWVAHTGLRLLQGSTGEGVGRCDDHVWLNAYFGPGSGLRELGITRSGLFGESRGSRPVVTVRVPDQPDS